MVKSTALGLLLFLINPFFVFGEFPFVGCVFHEKMKDGHFFRTAPKSQIKVMEGNFLWGKKEGVWTFYWYDSQKKQEGAYKNDLPDGIWSSWWENGKKCIRGRFDKGIQTGFWSYGNPNGGNREEGYYTDDKRTGIWHTWYDSGQISSEGAYENGIPAGWWTYWYPDGQIRSKIKRSVPSSSPNGDDKEMAEFRSNDGKLIEYQSWAPPGLNITDICVQNKQNCLFYTITISDYTRREFIQRSTDKKPILYYQHERIIEPILGHQGNLLLINDHDCVDCNNVLICDLNTLKSKRINKQVFDHYKNFVSIDPNTQISTPQAIGLSPDDLMVLIHMDFSYAGGPLPEVQKAQRKYRDWSYVVDSTTGNILKIYKTKAVPSEWWKI